MYVTVAEWYKLQDHTQAFDRMKYLRKYMRAEARRWKVAPCPYYEGVAVIEVRRKGILLVDGRELRPPFTLTFRLNEAAPLDKAGYRVLGW